MAINLNKNKDSMILAWKDVLDEKTNTNWALFGYEGLTNDLKFVSKGDGGLTELIDEFNSGKIQYAFLKLDMPSGSVSKYVLINWQGEGAPTVRKGTCANHLKHVSQLFPGFHVTMHARTEDDLDEKVIMDKLSKAGSAFNVKSGRPDELPPSGPVGTTYQKVNPVKEINSKERDQFWLKEEQEEKQRVEAERRRFGVEKLRVEAEVKKRREREDAAKRAQAENENGVSDVWKNGGAADARSLIGSSTAAARAVFQQHLAQGQMRSSGDVPEKPARSTGIAQRISAFNQQTISSPSPIKSSVKSLSQEPKYQTIDPKSPTSTQETSIEQVKRSPLKNIDKIKMSLESPSQIQHEPIIDPAELSPSSEVEPKSFSAINYSEIGRSEVYRDIESKQSEPIIKQNILENDMFDTSYASSNEYEDEDSDNKFSTIKRSPYSRTGASDTQQQPIDRQNTVIDNINYKNNEHEVPDDLPPDVCDDETIYQDLDDDPGLTARALYDYQAADDTEITFDPGDIITHIEQIDPGWWQGLSPRGLFGLFPANYVELLPHTT